MPVLLPKPEIVLFQLKSADFNKTTDNTLAQQFVAASYFLTRIRVLNASISLTTAAGGIYTAVSKGGIAVVSAAQTYAALTGPTLGMDLTIAGVGLDELTAQTLYLNLTTAQGAAATADVYVMGVPLS